MLYDGRSSDIGFSTKQLPEERRTCLMTLDINKYKPLGDKKNSEYFHDYLARIYDRRQSSGLEDLLGGIPDARNLSFSNRFMLRLKTTSPA